MRASKPFGARTFVVRADDKNICVPDSNGFATPLSLRVRVGLLVGADVDDIVTCARIVLTLFRASHIGDDGVVACAEVDDGIAILEKRLGRLR